VSEFLTIKLGNKQYVENDELGRKYIGYEPSMTDEAIYEAARGIWHIDPTRLLQVENVLVANNKGYILQTIEVTGLDKHDNGKVSFRGRIVYSDYNGQQIKLPNRNSIRYMDSKKLASERIH